jgi:hypothetical protein
MNGENILKGVHPTEVVAKRESAHAVQNDISELTNQIRSLSEDISYTILGPVPEDPSVTCECAYRLVDRLQYERSELADIRAILQRIRDGI